MAAERETQRNTGAHRHSKIRMTATSRISSCSPVYGFSCARVITRTRRVSWHLPPPVLAPRVSLHSLTEVDSLFRCVFVWQVQPMVASLTLHHIPCERIDIPTRFAVAARCVRCVSGEDVGLALGGFFSARKRGRLVPNTCERVAVPSSVQWRGFPSVQVGQICAGDPS